MAIGLLPAGGAKLPYRTLAGVAKEAATIIVNVAGFSAPFLGAGLTRKKTRISAATAAPVAATAKAASASAADGHGDARRSNECPARSDGGHESSCAVLLRPSLGHRATHLRVPATATRSDTVGFSGRSFVREGSEAAKTRMLMVQGRGASQTLVAVFLQHSFRIETARPCWRPAPCVRKELSRGVTRVYRTWDFSWMRSS